MADRPRLLFLIGEDWFFRSHYRPMGRAARDMGFDVVVLTRSGPATAELEAEGFRVIPWPGDRNAASPLAVLRAMRHVLSVLRAERPDIVHAIALRNMVIGGYCAWRAGVRGTVLAVTGLGLVGAARTVKAAMIRTGLRLALWPLFARRRTRVLVQNPDDLRTLRRLGQPPDRRVAMIGGAGVDPADYPAHPEPAAPPVVVTMISRMLWSKGPDLAVDAIRRVRERGVDVRLQLVGASDTGNPRAIPEATLRDWANTPGIAWLGQRSDVAEVWASSHIALLPTRGGEGVPRSLLEAASCGRAIVTTDVPGCRHFVEDGVTGLLVPPEDADALAGAIERLAADAGLRDRLGMAVRHKVQASHSETHVAATVRALWQGLLET